MKTENLTDCAIIFARKEELHVRLDDPFGCVPGAVVISSKVQYLHFESALWVN